MRKLSTCCIGRSAFGQLIGHWGKRPDFLIIGTQKGGTTSLYSYLAEHPQVTPALIKEVHYFDFHYACGAPWYRAHFPTLGFGKGTLTGEASPGYLFNPYAAARGAAFAPDLKLIVMLRNPVERALSHYQMSVRRDREHLPFAEALEQEGNRLSRERQAIGHERAFAQGPSHRDHSHLSRGHYAEQLDIWLEHFPIEQLPILESERFFTHPEQVHLETLALSKLYIQPLRRTRTLRRSKLEPERCEQLAAYFEPHSARLEALLGRAMWQGE